MSAVVSFGISKKGREVKGESKLKEHEEWCDIKHFSFAMNSPRQLGSAASTGRRTYDTIKITKPIDLASIHLWQIGVENDYMEKVEIHLLRNRDNAKEVFFTFKLKNASVASIRMVSSIDDKDQPEEEVSLAFQEIEITYLTAGLGATQTSNLSGIDQWSSALNT